MKEIAGTPMSEKGRDNECCQELWRNWCSHTDGGNTKQATLENNFTQKVKN